MNPEMQKFYQHLPYGLRCAGASVWGYRLRAWRYGPQTDRKTAEALERESWDQVSWNAWREEKLPPFLDLAAREVPYYRKMWESRRKQGDRSDWGNLENWPLLTKEEVRANPEAFVRESSRRKRLYLERTGGTTGTPLKLWQGRETLQEWYALFEARWRNWYGVSRHDRWAIIGGQRIIRPEVRKPPFWVWNAGLRQLYISCYHLFPEYAADTLEAVRKSRAVYLLGYTSSLYFIACEILEQSLTPPPLKVVITNAEPLNTFQKEKMEKAFRCPVRETYGMAEMSAAASECEKGTLHLWPETGFLEVLQNGSAVPPGEPGELVSTGLIHRDMPLIRYETGDRIRLAAEDSPPCLCGRKLPRLACVEGRKHDVLKLKDGRTVWYFNPVFAGLPVRESQIIQERTDVFTVQMSCSRVLSSTEEASIIKRMLDLTGPARIQLTYSARIPRESNGKFRSVISRVAADSESRQEPS